MEALNLAHYNLTIDQIISDPVAAIPLVMTILPAMLLAYDKALEKHFFEDHGKPPNEDVYFDIIIVGAGAAGSVLTSRLSDPSNGYSVLTLDAGGFPNEFGTLPCCSFAGSGGQVWNYRTTSQRNSMQILDPPIANVSSGKVIGGSTSTGLNQFLRGNPKDYDNWATTVKHAQWNSDAFDEYFKRVENYNGKFKDPEFHGCAGPLSIENLPYRPNDYFDKAIVENGFEIKDINKNQERGYMPAEMLVRKAVTFSVVDAYINPVLKRENLIVQPYAEVQKILFDGTKAVGVQFIVDGDPPGTKRRAFADRQVIISAGALNTPKILQLSGVGPAAHLRSLGIPVVLDLPVGNNFADMVLTGAIVTFKDPISFLVERDISIEALMDPAQQKNSIITGANCQSVGYQSSMVNDDPKHPDILHWPMYFALPENTGKIFKSGIFPGIGGIYDAISEYEGKDSNIQLVVLTRPKSRGTIRIQSSNPEDPPAVEPNYLGEEQDTVAMADGLRKSLEMYINSTTYQQHGAAVGTFSKCVSLGVGTLDYYKCYVKHTSLGGFSYSGTAKMGQKEDGAVVCPQLRVHGAENLRVVDASVIPTPPNTYYMATILAMAERASDIIIKDLGGRPTVYPTKCHEHPGRNITLEQFFQDIIEKFVSNM